MDGPKGWNACKQTLATNPGAYEDEESAYIQQNVDETANGVICLLCGTVIKQKFNVKRHFAIKHNVGNQCSYRCPLCQRVYKNKHSFSNHVYMVHKEMKGLTFEKYAIKE